MKLKMLMKSQSEPLPSMNGTSRTVLIEISSNNALSIKIPERLERYHTSSWLLSSFLAAARMKSSSSGGKVVALQTLDKSDIHTNYMLSLQDTHLSLLPEKLKLAPVYSNNKPQGSKRTLDDFEIVAQIGQGGFARVYLVRSFIDGKFYALKQLRKSDYGKRKHLKIYRERNIMAEVKSKHIARLHYAFQTRDYCYFVMEYVPCGNLLSLRNKVLKFSEYEVKFYVAGILLALKDLHLNSVIYRDLKPENILLDIDGYIKLCDFGIAKNINGPTLQKGSFCGTPEFFSPEMAAKIAYDYRVDYYALGVIAYELLIGKLPFEDPDPQILLKQIRETQPRIPAELSPAAKDFLTRLLWKDPDQRLGAKNGILDIFAHPWLKDIDFEAMIARRADVPFVRDPMTLILERLPSQIEIEKGAGEKTELTTTESPGIDQRMKLFSYAESEDSSDDEEDYILETDRERDYSQGTEEFTMREELYLGTIQKYTLMTRWK